MDFKTWIFYLFFILMWWYVSRSWFNSIIIHCWQRSLSNRKCDIKNKTYNGCAPIPTPIPVICTTPQPVQVQVDTFFYFRACISGRHIFFISEHVFQVDTFFLFQSMYFSIIRRPGEWWLKRREKMMNERNSWIFSTIYYYIYYFAL